MKSLENIIEGEGPGTIAAFTATPIPSGNQIPAEEYWPRVRELCDKHGSCSLLTRSSVVSGVWERGSGWSGSARRRTS